MISSRPLASYPRPSVAVDAAVVTVLPADAEGGPAPSVLLVRRETGHAHGDWSLPGTFVHERETLAAAVDRCLADKAGIRGMEPRQLHVFDDSDRDDRGWVLSIAHLVVVPYDRLGDLPDRARLVPIIGTSVDPPGRRRKLPFDHPAIVELALTELRERYAASPDPDGLLNWPTTFGALRAMHESIAGEPLQKDAFRRRTLPHLVTTGRWTEGRRGKPAELFELAAATS